MNVIHKELNRPPHHQHDHLSYGSVQKTNNIGDVVSCLQISHGLPIKSSKVDLVTIYLFIKNGFMYIGTTQDIIISTKHSKIIYNGSKTSQYVAQINTVLKWLIMFSSAKIKKCLLRQKKCTENNNSSKL